MWSARLLFKPNQQTYNIYRLTLPPCKKNPGLDEICGDGIDTNCNNLTDEDCDGKKCPFVNLLGEESPNIADLRYFRDTTLVKSAIGRNIVAIYYNNTDSINAALDSSPALRAAARPVLEIIAPLLGRKEE